MWKIKNVPIENRIIAAPLAGISNPVYRLLNRKEGAGLTVSEMISDKALHYKNERTFDMCRILEEEHPVSLQLFSGDPETMAEAAEYLSGHTDCDIIDINMGCPVAKVLKAHAGSYLMAHPGLAVSIAEAAIRHTDRPVTVKMRAGWDKDHINAPELAKALEGVGVSAVAVHGRTKSMMYQGKSDNAVIRMVKEAVSIPVIGNGDVRTAADYKRMLEETGCDAVMIGRGLLGRPYLISELLAYENGEAFRMPSYEERIERCREYGRKLTDYEGERTGIPMLRGQACAYFEGMPNAAKIRKSLTEMNTLEEFHRILNQYRDMLAL